jgi:hypothetical protein
LILLFKLIIGILNFVFDYVVLWKICSYQILIIIIIIDWIWILKTHFRTLLIHVSWALIHRIMLIFGDNRGIINLLLNLFVHLLLLLQAICVWNKLLNHCPSHFFHYIFLVQFLYLLWYSCSWLPIFCFPHSIYLLFQLNDLILSWLPKIYNNKIYWIIFSLVWGDI